MISSLLKRLSWQTLLVALASGGIIHICATLVMPQLATASGVQRLSEQLQPNRMRVLPHITAENQLLPFVGPDVRLAVCRYDVSDGPVRISAILPDKGWSLALYTLQGDNFYVVPAQDYRRVEASFQLMPQTDRFLGFINLGRSIETSASQIQVPTPQGLVVIRAPLRGRAYQADTDLLPTACYSLQSTFLMVLLVPAILTMRCFAEERKTGSIETLCNGVNGLVDSMADIVSQVREAADARVKRIERGRGCRILTAQAPQDRFSR